MDGYLESNVILSIHSGWMISIITTTYHIIHRDILISLLLVTMFEMFRANSNAIMGIIVNEHSQD